MTTMACWSVPVCSSVYLLLTVLSSHVIFSVASSSQPSTNPSFTCSQVREFFEGGFGSPESLHSHPVHETHESICGKRYYSGRYTCCSTDTERKFAETAEKRLKENVRTQNHALKKHITNILGRYQDRITLLVAEARNRTVASLSNVYRIPPHEQEEVVTNFFTSLERGVASGTIDSSLDDVVRDFFKNLFPSVFSFVLSVQGQASGSQQPHAVSAEYHACLRRYADQIQPFGNQPDLLLRHLRRALWHAVVFQDAMKVFTDTMTSTEAANTDSNCTHALLRLQVCHGCGGISRKGAEVKPCRGMCLNVMRGCLAKILGISSSWDDLVVAFENLEIGMMGQHELQKMLLYMDANVSAAVMAAMEDSARIYDEVTIKCHNIQQTDDSAAPLPTPAVASSASSLPAGSREVEAAPPRHTDILQSFHNELKSLVKYLDDSKGMFNRLADDLCQSDRDYDQDMQSHRCWNGTHVGRYMHQVPEANFMSQVQHNREVLISLLDRDFKFLVVRENLIHMRKNLSNLLNSDVMMMGDRPYTSYKNVAATQQEGSGQRSGHPEVIVDNDDEDLAGSGSGYASGSGDDQTEVTSENTPVVTKTPTKPTRPPATPTSSAPATMPVISAFILSCVCHKLWSIMQ